MANESTLRKFFLQIIFNEITKNLKNLVFDLLFLFNLQSTFHNAPQGSVSSIPYYSHTVGLWDKQFPCSSKNLRNLKDKCLVIKTFEQF